MTRKNESLQKAAMRDMMSVILEDALNEELGYSKYDYRNKDTDNSRNGKRPCIPAMGGHGEKNLSMYAKGMTTGDIESHMKELYDMDISDSTISREGRLGDVCRRK